MKKQKLIKRKRPIDRVIQENYSWVKEKIVLMNKTNVKTWHGVAFFAFLVGVVISITWMARVDMGVTSQAGNDKSVADTEELKQIKDKIKEKGAKWEAGETSISKLSPEERKKRLGLKKEDKSGTAAPTNTSSSLSLSALPATLDWRNNNGNFVTPIKDQRSCGSCWAFATTAAAESANLIAQNIPYDQNSIDLSEQVMVSCSGAGSCSGGYFSGASQFLKNTGLPIESCYPYTATNGNCSSACANWQSSTTKISGYTSYSSPGTDTIKNTLAINGPLVAEMSVYSDFYYYKSGIYSYTSGSYQGEHAVTIVGYDDASQYFIVKNSWGTGWGMTGYFNIAYSQLATVTKFGSWVYAYTASSSPPSSDTITPQASLTSPADGATVSGTTAVTVSASDNVGVTKVEFYVDNTLQATDTSSPYNFNWNTTAIANGTHTLSAKAYDAAGNTGTAASVSVTVSNAPQPPDTEPPTISLISPLDNSTVTKTLKINATGSDNVGVVSMRALIDGSRVCSSITGTLSCSVNVSRKYAKGLHVISVEAADAAGNKGTAASSVTFR